MHGHHARPSSSTLFGSSSAPSSDRTAGRHSRPGRIATRLRRRFLVYGAVEFLSTHVPDDPGPGEECLLLVHTRQVVGEVHYRMCARCARGVITDVTLDERFHGSGLGTRALSHLRARHPGTAWHSTLTLRATRDLLRRMRIPTTDPGPLCAHAG
ncbi:MULTISPECIES: hypothetical protein [unclassified Streptomyces]|uniref:hypothetical protein n=1 Tax=Streptomyces sp. NPDC007872 TaxID=3364782 RepID=UPI0036C13BAA